MEKLHCQVDIAIDGEAALQQINQQDYDLIFMDIGLPGNDGCEVTRRIRLKQWRSNPSVPIIGLTAHVETENKRRCLEAGMEAVFTEPLTPAKALEILEAFVPSYQKTSPYSVVSESENSMDKELAVLDVDKAFQLGGNKEFVKETFTLMINNLIENLDEFPQLFKRKEWQAIKDRAHKLKGGASYCGALRLEQACKQIDDYIREHGPIGQTNQLYQQLIKEMESAQTVCEDYIK
ncbi:MAG: response regulator [Candidatus Aquirickettsiella sp.]